LRVSPSGSRSSGLSIISKRSDISVYFLSALKKLAGRIGFG
jgi:hypothetical protein